MEPKVAPDANGLLRLDQTDAKGLVVKEDLPSLSKPSSRHPALCVASITGTRLSDIHISSPFLSHVTTSGEDIRGIDIDAAALKYLGIGGHKIHNVRVYATKIDVIRISAITVRNVEIQASSVGCIEISGDDIEVVNINAIEVGKIDMTGDYLHRMSFDCHSLRELRASGHNISGVRIRAWSHMLKAEILGWGISNFHVSAMGCQTWKAQGRGFVDVELHLIGMTPESHFQGGDDVNVASSDSSDESSSGSDSDEDENDSKREEEDVPKTETPRPTRSAAASTDQSNEREWYAQEDPGYRRSTNAFFGQQERPKAHEDKKRYQSPYDAFKEWSHESKAKNDDNYSFDYEEAFWDGQAQGTSRAHKTRSHGSFQRAHQDEREREKQREYDKRRNNAASNAEKMRKEQAGQQKSERNYYEKEREYYEKKREDAERKADEEAEAKEREQEAQWEYDEYDRYRSNAGRDRYRKRKEQEEQRKAEEEQRKADQKFEDYWKRDWEEAKRKAKANANATKTQSTTQWTLQTYIAWRLKADEALASKETMTAIPQLPKWTCYVKGCERIEEVKTCRHSIEKLFECAHGYAGLDRESVLKEEWRRWHPDRFQRCPEWSKQSIAKGATVIFQVIGSLLEEYKKRYA